MERANAAQLAARKIKDRPRARRAGSKPADPNSVPQFAPMHTPSQTSGGGLFGGSIQAPGEFNFSAPAQGLNLSTPSFGSKANIMNTQSQDMPESEERFAGDDRATKRRFGGSSTVGQSNSPFQTSNPFGQSQPSNIFGSSQQPSGGNMFPFGGPQQSGSSGINFNSGSTTPANPANNPFSFQPASRPAATTTSTIFGSGPFDFNQQSSQPTPGNLDFTASASGSFGSATAAQQDNPATSPFLFGQTSGQPSSSGIAFGSIPAPAPPTNTLFGSTSTAPSVLQTSSLFGNPIPTAPSSNSLFGSTTSTAPQASSIFGIPSTAPSQDKPTSSTFSFDQTSTPLSSSGTSLSSAPATASTTNKLFEFTRTQQRTQPESSFVASTQQTASSSNPFAHLNAPASSASSVFAKPEQKSTAPATSNVFSVPDPVQASTNNAFSTSTQTSATPSTSAPVQQPQPSPANNIFENLNKSTTPTTDFSSQKQQALGGGAFGNKEALVANNLFGNLNKPVDQSVTQPRANGSASEKGLNNNPSLFSKGPSTANNFEAAKPLVSSLVDFIDACRAILIYPKFNTSPAKPAEPTSGLKQSATPHAGENIFSPMKPLDVPASARQPPPNGMFPSLEQVKSPQKSSGPPSMLATPAASSISEASKGAALRGGETSVRQQMKEATEMTDESVALLIPPRFDEFQQRTFYQGYRMQTLNNAMSNFFASVNPDEDATPVLEFYMQQRGLIMGNSKSLKRTVGAVSDEVDHTGKRLKQTTPSITSDLHEKQSKRKLHDEEDQENENPTKRTRQNESSNSARVLANGEINFTGQSSASVNRNNFQPSIGLPSSPDAPLKRKADNQITKDSEQRSPLRNMKIPKTNGIVEPKLSGSSTSNIFRNILDSPPKSPVKGSPERKMAGLPENSNDDTPRPNAFANLLGVSSPTKSTIGSSLFGPKAPTTIPSAPQNPFTPKPVSESPSVFTPKPANVPPATTGSISTVQKPTILKLPTFNNAANNFEYFAQQGKDNDEKELQKAIEADYDSEDDLEEFKAKWRADKLEKRKAIEAIGKNAPRFVPKTALSPDASSDTKEGNQQANIVSIPFPTAAQSSTTSGSLFVPNTSPQASNSISSSVNSSRTPTPAFGSSTGSVLDGHTPAKPGMFSNIFGHLSDADSGKGGDADDESEEDNETSDAEEDSETKDPTYQPNGESASGPGTPAEETGPGLASANKANPFTSTFSSASPSGTSTPKGSIFDRIGPKESNGGTSTPTPGFTGGLFDRIGPKDNNGNIVRHKFSEEKENTQPSTANPFGDMKNPFNKSTGAPSDNTWKPDSPIRFGSATPRQEDQDPAPTVSVTAPTPTKTGSPSNIFGSLNKPTGSAPKPLSNLFGNIGGDAKPAASFSSLFGTPNNTTSSTSANVGFAFGASSTTSSLFPSAAVSATTSRATTPGGTTDGDGDNSGDGDAEQEKTPDFNLSTVGPGAEDEEVIHEIRAKALKFVQKEGGDNTNRWDSRGVGPLRVLKHKESGASRVLLRMDPSGVIILNKALLPGVKYEQKEKTVKLLAALEDGTGMETWILQVKTPESAKALSEVLEANKPT